MICTTHPLSTSPLALMCCSLLVSPYLISSESLGVDAKPLPAIPGLTRLSSLPSRVDDCPDVATSVIACFNSLITNPLVDQTPSAPLLRPLSPRP